jgi:FAD/FMN-containing dehydrogenase
MTSTLATMTYGNSALLKDAVFNGAVSSEPRGVVQCSDEASISRAVRNAADQGIPVSVLAGGHDIAGRALGEGNLVLDLRGHSRVSVDIAAREATVEGAALTKDLLTQLPNDLAAVTGMVLTVGLTGYTLGGGYGHLNSRFGLGSDCLKRARVVLADGSVVTASPEEDAELLWALRGGGSGFGVVSSMTIALHPLPPILTAAVLCPLGIAHDALLLAQDLLDVHPVDLSLFIGFVTGPDGKPVLLLEPVWSGERTIGERLIDDLAAMDGVVTLGRGWCPYKETLSEEKEKAWPKGRHYELETRTLRRIDRVAADILIQAAQTMTSPFSAIALHDFHGAPTKISSGETAFPLRDNHFVVEVIAQWEPGENGARHRDWARHTSEALARVAMPGGYVNLLKPEEADRARLFYGSSAQRLRKIKERVDPYDLFRSGTGRLT